MIEFKDQLEQILEEQIETGDPCEDLISIATELMDQISNLQKSLDDAQLQLRNIVEKLNCTLGMEIRKKQPKMHISLDNNSCTCGYKSKDLSCKPNLENGRWEIGGRLGRGFVKNFPQSTKLTSDVKPLANSVVTFFKKHYRTL